MKVCEIFYSIQGEGILIGTPTVFIRTTGCNLRCTWCDSQYAYEEGKEMKVDDIVREVRSFKCLDVCITGGEPLLQPNMTLLIRKLLERGHQVVLETNGSMMVRNLPSTPRLVISMDVKCPSSGMHDRMCFSNIKYHKDTDQLKFVLKNENDYEYAKGIILKFRPLANVIFQPVGGRSIRPIAEKVLRDKLDVRVLFQMHKLIWGDERAH